MIAIANCRGLKQDAEFYSSEVARMQDSVLKHGWDGEWFLRAYDGFGDPVGSHHCDEGKIFIEPQGFCVYAGLGLKDNRAALALDSVREHLGTKHGIVLQQPAYSRYYVNLGEISSYPPGYKENAGVFCHNNPWVMIGEARVGRGDRAFDYYARTNPSAREDISDLHGCEPYVYAQMIAGPDSSDFGQAKNSWLTGAAAWNYVAITQWILGVRPSYQGLRIAPVVPANWTSIDLKRRFRGVTYNIHVERSGQGNEIELVVDGTPLPGNLVPIPPAGQSEVKVAVKVGATVSAAGARTS
jgi:cellobiose phosphorylase